MTYTLHTSVSYQTTYRELGETFEKWGVEDWVVDTYQNKAVVLRYTLRGRKVTLDMAQQDTTRDNLRVLYLAVESMRMNEKRGLGDIIESAYLQIAAPVAKRDPYEVLGITSNSPIGIVEVVYKALAKEYHPDGVHPDATKFKEVTEAIEELRRK